MGFLYSLETITPTQATAMTSIAPTMMKEEGQRPELRYTLIYSFPGVKQNTALPLGTLSACAFIVLNIAL